MTEELTQFERTGNPFPGLRPFETEEYNLFFGREGQSDELLTRLGRTRFLAVVGTSGSGKSSLIRAGLKPALYGGLMAGTGSGWRIAVMRPGHDPLGNLARALADDSVLGSPEVEDAVAASIIETTLRRSTLGLVDAARQARLPAGDHVLVVVDQFEELFRFRAMRAQQGTDDEASAFVKLLLEAPRQREVSLYVVLTMRSDFLGDCSQFQGLPEAINDGQYLIPRMTRDERRMAITGPALVGDGEISPPLLNRLLNDVGDNPDQLPILQHALMRTWDEWKNKRPEHAKVHEGDTLNICCYETVGAMSDALSQHADEAWDELKDERGQHVAEVLFKALTERGTDNREVRRPTRLREVCEITGATPAEVAAVVEVFRREGRSFLMPPVGTPLEPETVIDISHESLIRNWARLRDWVKEEAESARIYRRLAEAAAARLAGEGGLLDDVTLGWVNRWRNRYEPNRAWGVRYHPGYDEAMAHLKESQASSDARIAAEGEREQRELEAARALADERERQRQAEVESERREREQAQAFAAAQTKSARRLRMLLVAIAVMLLLALGTAGYAMNASRVAAAAQMEAAQAAAKALVAQAEAEKSAREVKEGAARLQKAKDEADELASNLLKEKEKTDKALIAQQRALVAQKKAAAFALHQTALAKAAETKAKNEREAAMLSKGNNAIHLAAIASLQREDYESALGLLDSALAGLAKEAKTLPPPGNDGGIESALRSHTRGSVLTHKGETLRKLGKSVEALGAYNEAVKLQRGVKEVFRSEDDEMTLALFDAVHGLADAYRDLGRKAKEPPPASDPDADAQDYADGARKSYAASEKFFKEALEIQQRVYKDKSPSALASGYENLARLYRDLGRFTDAEPFYRQVVELREKNNPASPETLSALKEQAQFYAGQNDRDASMKALDTYEKLFKAQEGVGGDEQFPAWADTYSEIGEVYLGLGDDTRSDASFRLARLLQGIGLKLKQIHRAGNVAAHGSEEEKVSEMFRKSGAGKDMEETADLFVQLGKYDTAVGFYRMLAGAKMETGDRTGAAEIMLKTAKVALDNLQDKPTAFTAYTSAVQLLQSTQGANPALLAEALTGVGRVTSEEKGAADSAKEYYAQALEVLGKAPGYERETYATLTAEAEFYKRQGKQDDVLAVSRRKLSVASALLDSNSPNSVQQKLWDARAYTEAFGLYTQAVKDLSEAFAASGDAAAADAVFAELLDQRLDVGKVLDPDVVVAYTLALEGRRDALARMVRPPAAESRNYAEQVQEAQARREELYQIRGVCPYTLNVSAPSSVLDGDVAVFSADANYTGGRPLSFTWTADVPGLKIQSGQGTPTATVNTTGLGGKSVTLTVAADNGSGVATCRVNVGVTTQVSQRKQ